MPLEPGTRLGPYEIETAIGAGGMGEVYRGRDTRLDRRVAIKVLLPHLASNESVRQRFEREARSISQLTHPNICALYDVGHEEETSYLVMEFLEGRSLADRLAEGALRPDETLKYGTQIAEALAAAHRRGVIHRDLKPGNVMLTPAGAKLLDFGLAKALPQESNEPTGLTSSLTMAAPLTTAGTLVGTFQYMSPEQLEGNEADARSDVFAFGATIYEMATGKKAFDGKSQASVIASVLEKEPPAVSSIQPMTPPGLTQLITQCLRKNPDDRRQSMHDIALELRWMQDEGSQAGVPTPVRARRRSRERTGWIVAVASFLAVTFALLFALGRIRSEGDSNRTTSPLHAQLAPPEGRQFELRAAHPGPPALSPNGRFLAYTAATSHSDDPPLLHIQDLSTGQVRTPPETAGAGYPFWSPDGRKIGYFAAGALQILDVERRKSTRICDAPNGKGGAWRADDVIVFAGEPGGPISAVDAAGGSSRTVTQIDTTRFSSHRFPQDIPGSDRFLFYARPKGQETPAPSVVFLGSLSGADPIPLGLDATAQASFADGFLVYLRARTLLARRFDPSRSEFSGTELQIADDVATIAGADFGLFTVSPTRLVHGTGMEASEERTLVWFDRRGRSLRELGEPGRYDRPRISPDGRSVAVEIEDPGDGTRNLWIMDAERGLPTRFTASRGKDEHAVWSPDSRRIAFASDRNGSSSIWVQAIEGGDAAEVATLPGRLVPISWSPDGRYLSVAAAADIWIVPLSGAEPYRFASTEEFAEWGATFSPDGQWVAYASNESGSPELYLTSFPTPGRKIRVSPGGGASARWSTNGRELLYVTQESEIYSVAVEIHGRDVAVGATQLLFEESAAREGDVAPDASTLLLLLAPDAADRPPLQLIENWQAGLGKS